MENKVLLTIHDDRRLYEQDAERLRCHADGYVLNTSGRAANIGWRDELRAQCVKSQRVLRLR